MAIACRYHHHPERKNMLTGNVELLLDGKHEVQIIDNAYGKTAIKTKQRNVIVDLKSSFGWYDFTIKVSGYPDFEKRYAGRVESGKPGYTDPFMGKVSV